MAEEEGSSAHDLIAGLPSEVAFSILARLPCVLYPTLRCVSRAWNDAFGSSRAVISYRRTLGMLQAWPLVRIRRASKPTRWYVIDPHTTSPHRIPSPPSIHIEDAAGSQLCVFATYRYDMSGALHFHCFDASIMQWQHSLAPPLQSDQLSFPSVSLDSSWYVLGVWVHASRGSPSVILDDYWYVVGGLAHESRNVQRIHVGNPNMLSSSSWESVPDLHYARECAHVVSRQGCLYVLGNRKRGSDQHSEIYSGEVWDPRKKEWTLVPQLWPFEVFGDHRAHEVAITVAMGVLFALKKRSKELMRYDDGKQEWISLGQIPSEDNEQFSKILGIDSELWLLTCFRGKTDVETTGGVVFWCKVHIFDVASLLASLNDKPLNLSARISSIKFDGEMDVFEHNVVCL